MKYKCLVLDHDDTIVNSTATIHYPAFQETLKIIRPDFQLTLEDYFQYNFEPGFQSFCNDILKLNQEEMAMQTQNWLNYVDHHIPQIYPGIDEILWEFKRQGGYICVVSHSMKESILRDYKANGLPTPDLIFGWDFPPHQRKPSSWPLEKIMSEFHLSAQDLVMVDDLKPGKMMADKVGVDFIGVGWSHSIENIQNEMKKQCDYYCESVDELKKIIFLEKSRNS